MWAERSDKQAKSAAQNPLHHKTSQSKKTLKIDYKSDHETVNVKFITTLFVVSKINLIIWQRNITSFMPRYDLGM